MANTTLSHRYSFSGSDTTVLGYYTGGNKFLLSGMHTLSCSVYEAKGRVRSLGFKSIRGFARAVREISGTMIMLVVGDHPLKALMLANPQAKSRFHGGDSRSWSIDATETALGSSSLYQYGGDLSYFHENNYTRIPTVLPPFNLLVHFQSEIPVGSSTRGNKTEEFSSAAFELIDVEIMGEGIVTSVNDMVTEIQYQFVARDYKEYTLNTEFSDLDNKNLDLQAMNEEKEWIELQKTISKLENTSVQRDSSGNIILQSTIGDQQGSNYNQNLLNNNNNSQGNEALGVSGLQAMAVIAENNTSPSTSEKAKIKENEVIALEKEIAEGTLSSEEEARKQRELIAAQADAEVAKAEAEAKQKKLAEEAEQKKLAQERRIQEELDAAAAEYEVNKSAFDERWARERDKADVAATNRENKIAELEGKIQDEYLSPFELASLKDDIDDSKKEVQRMTNEINTINKKYPDISEDNPGLADENDLTPWDDLNYYLDEISRLEEEIKTNTAEYDSHKKGYDSATKELAALKNESSIWGSGGDIIDPDGNVVDSSQYDVADDYSRRLEFHEIVSKIEQEETESQSAVEFIRKVDSGHPWSKLKIPGTSRDIDYYEIQRTNQGTLVKLYTKSSYNSYNYLINSNSPQTWNSLYKLMSI